MSALLVEAHMGNTLHVIYTRQRVHCGVILRVSDPDCSFDYSHVYDLKYSSCLSKLHSDPMKYRVTCLWLCLIWKEVLFLARVEKQATNIKCKFVSVSIYKSMYEAL